MIMFKGEFKKNDEKHNFEFKTTDNWNIQEIYFLDPCILDLQTVH